MKTSHNFKVFLLLFMMLTISQFTTLARVISPPSPPLLVLNQTEYRHLKGERYQAFNFVDTVSNDTICPLFIDPVISIRDLINFYRSDTAYNGMRIYPGLTTTTKLVSVICLAADDTSGRETGYRMLTNSDYTNSRTPFPPSGVTLPETPLQLHQRYVGEILIYTNPQPAYNSSSNTVRKSRYYSWTEIFMLISQNIPGFNIDTPSTYAEYKIKLETGFVDQTLVESFHQQMPVNNNADYHYGYTCILHILDPSNNSTVKASVINTPGTPYNAKYMETGWPCPPKCGTLHR